MSQNQTDQPALTNEEKFKPIPLNSWEEFEGAVKKDQENYEAKKKATS